MRRAEGAREYLDGRVPPADLAATLADLDRLNAWFGGHALSLARVRRVAAHAPRELLEPQPDPGIEFGR